MQLGEHAQMISIQTEITVKDRWGNCLLTAG